jgi:hypothetical protein
MGKTETIVLIFILIVAFAGIWFLFKGPGLATKTPIRSEGFTEQTGDVLMRAASGRACVCNDLINQQQRVLTLSQSGSIYDCRNMCQSSGWQFVALRQ